MRFFSQSASSHLHTHTHIKHIAYVKLPKWRFVHKCKVHSILVCAVWCCGYFFFIFLVSTFIYSTTLRSFSLSSLSVSHLCLVSFICVQPFGARVVYYHRSECVWIFRSCEGLFNSCKAWWMVRYIINLPLNDSNRNTSMAGASSFRFVWIDAFRVYNKRAQMKFVVAWNRDTHTMQPHVPYRCPTRELYCNKKQNP